MERRICRRNTVRISRRSSRVWVKSAGASCSRFGSRCCRGGIRRPLITPYAMAFSATRPAARKGLCSWRCLADWLSASSSSMNLPTDSVRIRRCWPPWRKIFLMPMRTSKKARRYHPPTQARVPPSMSQNWWRLPRFLLLPMMPQVARDMTPSWDIGCPSSTRCLICRRGRVSDLALGRRGLAYSHSKKYS